MTIKEFFEFIKNEIHTTVFATTDSKGLPVTCIIDIMLTKGEKLYFITAKGKSFYKRLKSAGYVSFSGIKGETTLTSIAVTVKGKVREVGSELLEEVFNENPYMHDIYASEESRKALTVFELYEGEGEYFDLSKKPIDRKFFRFGSQDKVIRRGYFINKTCTMCGNCLEVCPSDCIKKGTPFFIEQEHCLHCGNCFDICQINAVEKLGD